ncbi:hypothetical protein ES703_81543 [subsurface metagenome]
MQPRNRRGQWGASGRLTPKSGALSRFKDPVLPGSPPFEGVDGPAAPGHAGAIGSDSSPIPSRGGRLVSTAVIDDALERASPPGVGGYSSYQELTRDFVPKNARKRRKLRGKKAEEAREKQKTDIVKALKNAEVDYYADEVENCATEFMVFRCGLCGTQFGHPRTCKLRFCPRCANARGVRLAEKYADVFVGLPNPRHLTLTFLSVKHIDADYIRWCFHCLQRLVDRKFWKHLTFGEMVAFEVTYGPDGYHGHLHCYVSSKVGRLPIELIRGAWKRITGANWCFIEAVHLHWRKAVFEVVKYPLKVADFYDEPKAFREYVLAIEGVRLVRGYGAFCRLAEKFKPSGKLADISCPVCGQTGYIEKIASYEPASHFEHVGWGWRHLPHGPPEGDG